MVAQLANFLLNLPQCIIWHYESASKSFAAMLTFIECLKALKVKALEKELPSPEPISILSPVYIKSLPLCKPCFPPLPSGSRADGRVDERAGPSMGPCVGRDRVDEACGFLGQALFGDDIPIRHDCEPLPACGL